MNKIDEILDCMARDNERDSPYVDKSDWNWLDYLMLYGLPLAMFYCVIMLIRSLF